MKTLHIQSAIAAAFAAVIAIAAPAGAQQAAAPAVAIDNDDIGGVVRSASGPEAGVWVIAETRDLPVRYIKIVVTDDQGRYVIPDLPKANYDIWVRGYGLVDSPKVKSEPGKQLNLTAVLAPNEAEAAKYYPAIYWYAMMKIPEAEFFGSKDAPPNVKITDYLNGMKNNGCVGCHQLGQLSTRTIPEVPHGRGQVARGSLGAAHPVRTGRREHGRPSPPVSSAACRSSISATGPSAWPRASCRLPSRRGRRASSATSSSRCATGTTTSSICTT